MGGPHRPQLQSIRNIAFICTWCGYEFNSLNPITNHVWNIHVTVICAVLCVTNAQRQMPSWSTWQLNMSLISSPFALCRQLRFGYKIHNNHNITLAFLSKVSPGLVTSHQPSYTYWKPPSELVNFASQSNIRQITSS